jgi:hypothetical protein
MATLKNTTINDTGYIQLPSGNTGQRPTAANGMIRYNSETSKIEYYAGSWKNVSLLSDPSDVYSGAAVYAPFEDNKIYSSGTLTANTVEIVAYGSYGADEVQTSKTVLKNNGSGSQIRVPGGDPGSSHTVSMWFRSNSVNDYGMLFSKYSSPGTSSYGVDIWDGNGNGAIYLNTGDGSANPYSGSSGHRFNHSDWKHYCFTFNGSTASYYRDGSLIGNAPTYRTFNGYTGQWTIGTWSGSQFGQYALNNGRFRRFAVWHNSAKTSLEVAAIYAAGL